jgi:hypothetical protein
MPTDNSNLSISDLSLGNRVFWDYRIPDFLVVEIGLVSMQEPSFEISRRLTELVSK